MKVTYSLTIESGNAAFGETRQEALAELRRILTSCLHRLEQTEADFDVALRDANGNPVGGAMLSIEEDGP